MSSRAVARINLAALQNNFHQVKKFAPHSKVVAMIKANGYGHGLLRVASALSSADALGVARLEEVMQLREHGITQPIMLMSGFLDVDELVLLAQQQTTLVLHQLEQIKMIEATALAAPISVWLKIETGMHRLGLPPEQVAESYQRLMACSCVKKPIGFMTHLSHAYDKNSSLTMQQLESFNRLVSWPGAKSIANSAGIVAWPKTHADWVRPGIMLYGVSPMAEGIGADFGLKPVMTLSSKIIAIHHLRKGDTVGYGETWTCPQDMPLGVVAIGYGDGYPRHAKNGTPVLVGNQLCSLAGRVSMDMITVDLRNYPQARLGDPVVLWGDGLPAEQIALCADTIAYELFCNVTSRVPFVLA